jgi:site-specific DNA recombinase
MRAVLYARVSTEEQAQKYGLKGQVRELRAHATEKGYEVIGEFVDEGHSGAILDRPALARVRELVRARGVDVVLAHDPDRIARRLVLQAILHEEFSRCQVQLLYVTTPLDGTPEGKMFMQFKGVIAEYEREKIRERTMRGRREKARQGRYSGPPPFGYRVDPDHRGALLVDEEEAALVRMVYRWLVEERRSIRAITHELRALGVRPRRGRRWAKSSVAKLLTDERYVGRAYFNRRRVSLDPETGKPDGVRYRSREEWITVPVPALLEDGLFAQAQAQLARNRDVLAGRPPTRIYLLQGLARCGRCGRRMSGETHRGTTVYRCKGRDAIDYDAVRCRRWVSGRRVETVVWSTVAGVIRNPQVLRPRLEAYRARVGARNVEIASRGEVLRRQLAQSRRAVERLLDLYVDGRLTKSAFAERHAPLARQQAELEADLAAMGERLQETQAQATESEAIERACALAARGLDKLTAEGRQGLLKALLDACVIHDDRVEIQGVLPTSESSNPSARAGRFSYSLAVPLASAK